MRSFLSVSAVLGVVLCFSNVEMAAGAGGCLTDADCDDGIYCNGIEFCLVESGTCEVVKSCMPFIIPDCMIINDSCDEENDRCVDTDLCDDGIYCNGIEFCLIESGTCEVVKSCMPFVIPDCMIINDSCDEENDRCVDTDLCDDGIFCNGREFCDPEIGACAAVSACPPAIDGCLVFGSCDEENDACPGIPDDSLCPPGTTCVGGQCAVIDTAVPTVSTWGLAVMLLVLLCGSKVYFSRRHIGGRTA